MTGERVIKVKIIIDNTEIARRILRPIARKHGLDIDIDTGEVIGCHCEQDVEIARRIEKMDGCRKTR